MRMQKNAIIFMPVNMFVYFLYSYAANTNIWFVYLAWCADGLHLLAAAPFVNISYHT